jgi:lysyl-tRNA synthetase class 2
MLEWYVAYWNYHRNLTFIQEMLQEIIRTFCGSLQIEYQGKTLDFSGDWEQRKYTDLVLEETGIDLSEIETLEQLRSEIQRKELDLDCEKYMSLGPLVDALYKKTVRPKLVQPMFLMEHPAELVPLARRSDDNPRVLDMFQVVVNGWEIVKAYSELVDPEEQLRRLEEQAGTGDDESMMLELDYIECMEHGMPPNSGLGLGIDRLVALLANKPKLKEIILFPLLKPEQPDK